MSFLTTLLAFIAAISILVTIHELGHYAAARWFDVKILRFSIGFGKPLWIRRVGPDATEWVIAALPLGGFVRMADARDDSLDSAEAGRGFSAKPIWQRLIIILAGPIANFVLASLLYWCLMVSGTPGVKPYFAAPVAGTAAARADLREWDLLVAIDGQGVATWNDARLILLDRVTAARSAVLEVERASGRRVQLALDMSGLETSDLDGNFLGKLGLSPFRPLVQPLLDEITPGSVAERAGIKSGDRVTHIDDKPIALWDELVLRVLSSPGKQLRFTVERAASASGGPQVLSMTITPEVIVENGKTGGRIGVRPRIDKALFEKLSTTVQHGPMESISLAVVKVWDMSVFSLKMMGRMITGDVSWKNLSGPITIADYAGQSAKLGLLPFINYLALISVSLGVLNLLPIPVLDGGQLLYHIAEWIKGSPVSERAMEIGQQLGLMLLLSLSAFAFYNDIQRLVTG